MAAIKASGNVYSISFCRVTALDSSVMILLYAVSKSLSELEADVNIPPRLLYRGGLFLVAKLFIFVASQIISPPSILNIRVAIDSFFPGAGQYRQRSASRPFALKHLSHGGPPGL